MDDSGDGLTRPTVTSCDSLISFRQVQSLTLRKDACVGGSLPRILSSKSSGDRVRAMVVRGRSSVVPSEGDGSIRVEGEAPR